jgi:hypothetical protein
MTRYSSRSIAIQASQTCSEECRPGTMRMTGACLGPSSRTWMTAPSFAKERHSGAVGHIDDSGSFRRGFHRAGAVTGMRASDPELTPSCFQTVLGGNGAGQDRH